MKYRVKWSLISLGGGRTAKRGEILTAADLGSSVNSRLRKGSIEEVEPQATAPDQEPATDGFEDMKVAELKQVAEKRGVEVTGLTKKADIIAALRAAS